MVETLALWPRVRERAPFDAAEHNRLVNFLQGYIAAPFRLVQSGGNFALIWDPTADLFTFAASIRFNATLTLDNTIWLDGYKADHATSVHLIRVNASDIIELGDGSQRMTIDAALTNNTRVKGRDAANAVDITLIKLNASDIIEIGQTDQRITIAGALTNATYLDARNAANAANIHLVRLNSSDIIELAAANQRMTFLGALTNNTGLLGRDAANTTSYTLIKLDSSDRVSVGEAGRRTNLLGTVSAPAIDPPTIDGQVTAESQLAGSVLFTVSGGAVTLVDSYNVSGVAYVALGVYRIDWNRDFANTTYRASVTTTDATASSGAIAGGGRLAASLTVVTWDAAGALVDVDEVTVNAFGTLS